MKNLYLVTLKGMQETHGISYVVAENPTEAYEKVKKDLDNRDIGFSGDKVLDNIKLLAEDCNYPDCNTRLYL